MYLDARRRPGPKWPPDRPSGPRLMAQPICQAIGAFVHLPISQTQFGLLSGIYDGQFVRAVDFSAA